MNKPLFNVTFEIITEDSAKDGEAEERGFLAEDVSLRDALAELKHDFDQSDSEPPEADECPVRYPRWITFFGALKNDDSHENRAIHFPEELSQGSRMRIARLLDCYGVPKR